MKQKTFSTSTRVDRHHSLRLSVKAVAQGNVFRSDLQLHDMSPGGTAPYRSGCAPQLMLQPVKDGGIVTCWLDRDSARVALCAFDALGATRHCADVVAGSAPNAASTHGPGRRLLGFTPIQGGYALALAEWPGGPQDHAADQAVTRLLFLDEHGDVRHECPDLLRLAEALLPGKEAWGLCGPAVAASSRLAHGGDQVALHMAHLVRWPDGRLVQEGLALTVPVPPLTGRFNATARKGWAAPWLGSRSLDQRCIFDRFSASFVAASLTDGFPRALSLWQLDPDGPVTQVIHLLPGQPGAVEMSAELGGLVALRESYAVSFCAAVQGQPESRDTFVAFTSRGLQSTPMTVRISQNPPGVYSVDPKLAQIGPNLLVAWKRLTPATGELHHLAALVTPQAQLSMPATLVDGLFFHRPDDFMTDSRGGVNWLASRGRDILWYRLTAGRGT